MERGKGWLDELASERAAVDPEFAALNRGAEMMLKRLPLRKQQGLTQEDIAARMGISRALVAIVESRPHRVSLDRIAAYAEAPGARVEVVPPKVPKKPAVRRRIEKAA